MMTPTCRNQSRNFPEYRPEIEKVYQLATGLVQACGASHKKGHSGLFLERPIDCQSIWIESDGNLAIAGRVKSRSRSFEVTLPDKLNFNPKDLPLLHSLLRKTAEHLCEASKDDLRKIHLLSQARVSEY